MCSAVHQIALSCHADCSQDIVAGAHDIANSGLVELLDHPSRSRFELVLKDKEADEVKVRFSFRASHLLRFEPAQLDETFSCASNDSKASVSIVPQQVVVVTWDYSDAISM